MAKWKITVSIVFNEKEWIKDEEVVQAYKHTNYQKETIEAATWEEALEAARIKFKNENWYAIYVEERIADKHYMDHAIYNDDLYDELHVKYGR